MRHIGSVYWISRWWLSYGATIGRMRASSSTWCRYCKLNMETMFLDTKFSCMMIPRSMVHVFNGKNQLRSGKANQWWDSWQRRFLMIYLPSASRTSTPRGHIPLQPSINAGMLWHLACLHGTLPPMMSAQRASPRTLYRVNHRLQHSSLPICCKRWALLTARLSFQAETLRVRRRSGHIVQLHGHIATHGNTQLNMRINWDRQVQVHYCARRRHF